MIDAPAQNYFEDVDSVLSSGSGPKEKSRSSDPTSEIDKDAPTETGMIMRRKRLILAAVRVWELKRGAKD